MKPLNYHNAIIELLKSATIQTINQLDYDIIKNANVGILTKEDDDLFETDQSASDNIYSLDERIEKERDLKAQQEAEARAAAGKLSEELSTEIPQVLETVSEDYFDAVFIDIMDEWGNKGNITDNDVEQIFKQLSNNEKVLQTTIGQNIKAFIDKFQEWLNVRYVDLKAEQITTLEEKASLETIKTRMIAAISSYRDEIINQGFGIEDGVMNKSKFLEMKDNYIAYNLLNIIKKKKRIMKPKAFFSRVLKTPKEDIDLFEKSFYYRVGDENRENPKAEEEKQEAFWYGFYNWLKNQYNVVDGRKVIKISLLNLLKKFNTDDQGNVLPFSSEDVRRINDLNESLAELIKKQPIMYKYTKPAKPKPVENETVVEDIMQNVPTDAELSGVNIPEISQEEADNMIEEIKRIFNQGGMN